MRVGAVGEERGQRWRRMASMSSYFPESKEEVKPEGNFIEGVTGWTERLGGAEEAWERREDVM
jgi:hypothetical protein